MKINFRPWQPASNGLLLYPAPAIKSLPDWYKQKKPFIGDEKKHKAFPNGTKNVTVKWCNPFGDSLSTGYFIYLENDIQVTIDQGEQNLVWLNGGSEFVSQHSREQVSAEMIPESFSDQPWKFKNYWGIETPKGYSTLFTHPLNRSELPFLTLSGVVDTDMYKQPVNFPFLIRKNFEGIIAAGTPIAQVIPFKREAWSSEILDFDAEKIMQIESPFRRKIFRPYKTLFWSRKEWK
jgi:hypothetical protein